MPDLIERVIEPRVNDLGGGFKVRRALPFHAHKMVGPFIFFDHFGPVEYAPGEGFDVRPHPHIGLATVTYLFEGAMGHRDSLGSDLVIRPGAVNWMTAGRGITHSERTPDAERAAGQSMHGLQTWVALPKSLEMMEPNFVHHPEETLPRFDIGGANIRVLAGEAWGKRSPVEYPWGILYAAIEAPGSASIEFAGDMADERALYLVSGSAIIGGDTYEEGKMIVLSEGVDVSVAFAPGTKGIICGGQTMDGKRFIDWNFVASDKAMIETAKTDWQDWIDNNYSNERFGTLDEGEHIPLPG